MMHGLIQHPNLSGWEIVAEDIHHPADKARCDLIRNKRTGRYATTDGTSVRSVDQAFARKFSDRRSDDLADWIQERVIARAAELEMTAYAVAKATEGAVDENHVRNYLQRRSSMGSHKLQHVLRVLGIGLTVDREE